MSHLEVRRKHGGERKHMLCLPCRICKTSLSIELGSESETGRYSMCPIHIVAVPLDGHNKRNKIHGKRRNRFSAMDYTWQGDRLVALKELASFCILLDDGENDFYAVSSVRGTTGDEYIHNTSSLPAAFPIYILPTSLNVVILSQFTCTVRTRPPHVY